MSKKTRLSKLRVDEIASVNSPANQHARAVLAKRHCAIHASKAECDTAGCKGVAKMAEHDEQELDGGGDAMTQVLAAFDESIESIEKDEALTAEERVALIAESTEQFNKAVSALAQGGNNDGEDEMPNETVVKGLTPEQSAAVEEAIQKARETAKAENAEAIAKAVEAATGAISTRLQKAEEANAALVAKRAEDARIAKSAELVKGTPIKPEAIAKVLAAVESDTDALATVTDLLAKYATALKAGSTLRELGSRGDTRDLTTEVDADSPEGQIEKAVTEIRKANPKLTPAQAYAEALAANPDLYDALNA